MSGDLVWRAIAVNAANLALGCEVFEAEGATFVRQRSNYDIRDANHIQHVRASTPPEIDRLLAQADVEFAHAPHRKFECDLDTLPEFEARLALDGYTLDLALVMLLEGDLNGSVPEHDVRPLRDGDWLAFERLHAADWAEGREKQGLEIALDTERRMAAVQRRKSPPVRYWLVYGDGEARGYFNAWEGLDGMGQVENLFVHPDWRHRGMATALIHRCVADAREHGAGPVVIVADPTDTPMRMYAAMGFRPVAVKRSWRRDVATAGAR
jgi:GNAT superfamily N-acetyltransferase